MTEKSAFTGLDGKEYFTIFHPALYILESIVSHFFVCLHVFISNQKIHSPNSCGQVQVADIGIMGAPARKEDPATGKKMAVPGCKIFVGGRIGEDAHLALEPYTTGIPLEDLVPVLVDILKKEFGAVDAAPAEQLVVIDE